MKLSASVNEVPLPDGALLQEFADRGDYTDCFVARTGSEVTFPAYVEAFYTTRLFKLERLILKWLFSRPSSDDEAGRLARGEMHAFAAWDEYDRTDNQLIMMDFRQQTCSWFMLQPGDSENHLYFGSAVMRRGRGTAGNRMPRAYRSLMGLHRLYSRALLHAAAGRVGR